MHQTRRGKHCILWHAVAHRRGQHDGTGAQRRRDLGQRSRQTPSARHTQWGRDAPLRRQRLRTAAGADSFKGPPGPRIAPTILCGPAAPPKGWPAISTA
jgi:hypothetical protein